MTVFQYYTEHLDQLQARILHDVRFTLVVPALGNCWEYQGRATGRMGYRQIRVHGAPSLMAHRISYWAGTGVFPEDGELLLHQCDNPACVNPDHLKRGNHAENMEERSERSRQSSGLDHHKSIGAEAVQSTRYLLSLGKSTRAVARETGVSKATVARIAAGAYADEVPYDPAHDADFIPW